MALLIPIWAITLIAIVGGVALGVGLYFIIKAIRNSKKYQKDIITISSPEGYNYALAQTNLVRSACNASIYASPSGIIPSPTPVQIKDLVWDDTLAEMAQKYSEKMAKCNCTSHYLYNGCGGCDSKSGEDTYSQNPESGQNLALVSVPSSNKLSEEQIYQYAINSWSEEGYKNTLNHYTAMVWKDGTTLGCGIAYVENDNTNKYYVTCQYGSSNDSIPNTEGDESENVLCTIPIN
jgi:hypothetical protein